MSITKRRVLMIGGAVAALLMVGSAPATAASGAGDGKPGSGASAPAQPTGVLPAGFSSWTELFAVQDRLNAAADRITAAGGAGYAGVVAAPQQRALRVYWKGEVPAPVLQVAGKAGVPVVFESARFSAGEMIAETVRLGADPRVQSIGPKVDGSGLRVRLDAAAVPGNDLLATAKLPLEVTPADATTPVDRQNDSPPYYGGAAYGTPSAGCSTGWGIRLSGTTRVLSAGHCGDNGQTATDGGGDVMGTVSRDNNTRDTLVIGASGGSQIFVGAWNGGSIAPVRGSNVDYVGNVVCTSGARTGEHCGMTVTDVDINEGGWFPLNRASWSNTTSCAVARGDSGGPVFSYSGSNVYGRGTISRSHLGSAVCPNAPPADSGYDVYYAPLRRPAAGSTIGSLQYYGATLVTP